MGRTTVNKTVIVQEARRRNTVGPQAVDLRPAHQHVRRYLALGGSFPYDREKHRDRSDSDTTCAAQSLRGCENPQLEYKSYPLDEIAVRFSHRLVAIHPFANGNGRLSRTIADLLLVQHGAKRFTWGAAANLVAEGDVRQRYLDACVQLTGGTMVSCWRLCVRK